MKNKKYKLLLILFALSFLSSIALSTGKTRLLCDAYSECDIVKNSKYSYTFGISNNYYGIVIFAFMLVLVLMQIKNPTEKKEKTIKLGVMVASLVALYFLYLQAFVIKAYCRYCLLIDTSMLFALAITFTPWRKHNSKSISN